MEEKDMKLSAEFMDTYWEESMQGLKNFAEEYNIKEVDKDILAKLGNVRRPLMLVRGRPITVEQTKMLIAGEEPLFMDVAEGEKCWFDPRNERGVLKNIFYRQGYDWLSTWAYSDGTIGGNLIFPGKYPDWDELLPPYMHLGKKYPFLDLVIAYTTYDESCCFMCSLDFRPDEKYIGKCKCRDCQPYLDKIAECSIHSCGRGYNRNPDFEELYYRSWGLAHVRNDVGDSVVLTIWIHDGVTDVLFGRKAADKFNEYNSLYCAPEYAFMFSSEMYRYDRTCICDKSFVEDCFEYAGKPKSLCDEYIAKGFISPFKEDTSVVTKEWVIRQYKDAGIGR